MKLDVDFIAYQDEVGVKKTPEEDILTGKKKKVKTGVIFDTVSYEGRF